MNFRTFLKLSKCKALGDFLISFSEITIPKGCLGGINQNSIFRNWFEILDIFRHWLLRVGLAFLFTSRCPFWPISHILYSCHSSCSLSLPQSHRRLQTCLHRAVHIYASPWFVRLGICISHESISQNSQTCSQWSPWSLFHQCTMFKSHMGVFSSYFLAFRLIDASVVLKSCTDVTCKTCVVACFATSIKAGKMSLLCDKLRSNWYCFVNCWESFYKLFFWSFAWH